MTDMKETISLEEFRENAEEILATLGERIGPLVLTVSGKRLAVLTDYAKFQRQEGQALAAILKNRQRNFDEGRYKKIEEVVAEMRQETSVD